MILKIEIVLLFLLNIYLVKGRRIQWTASYSGAYYEANDDYWSDLNGCIDKLRDTLRYNAQSQTSFHNRCGCGYNIGIHWDRYDALSVMRSALWDWSHEGGTSPWAGRIRNADSNSYRDFQSLWYDCKTPSCIDGYQETVGNRPVHDELFVNINTTKNENVLEKRYQCPNPNKTSTNKKETCQPGDSGCKNGK